MKTDTKIRFISLVMLFLIILTPLFADEGTSHSSYITAPWDEFKKLLHLDEKEIVLPLDTYQKLVIQTGIKMTQPPAVKDGNVILTRQEFQNLVNRMKPPSDPDQKPPFDYLITKSVYSGFMQNQNTQFRGLFTVHVLKKEGYTKVPLLHQNIALQDLKIDGKQPLVVSENGYHHVVLNQAGEYRVEASFSLKSSLDKGPNRIDFTIQKTPITLLNLEMPLKNIDVEVPQAQQIQTRISGNKTIVSSILASGNTVSIRWRKKVETIEKIPPKLYSETYHLISIQDDGLKINSEIHYNILHSKIDGVRIVIPNDVNILTISGEGIGEWQESPQKGERSILIPFTYGKKGNIVVYISSEKPLTDGGTTTTFEGIRILDTVRETGYLGIELNTSAEVKVIESQGLEKVSFQKLPQQLTNKSAKPLIDGFKYLKHPYHLALDIKKHEKIAVPIATIKTASVVTLFTEDGKVVHRLIYQVRNSAKQFLEIELPEKADVWSVFVNNEPVESSLNSEKKLLVPLIRSRSVNNQLDTFPVEVIYCLVEDRFSMLSIEPKKSNLPKVDLFVSQIIWSVYLPNDYTFVYFKSTLEKEENIRGINIFAGARRQFDEKAVAGYYDLQERPAEPRDQDQYKKAYKGKDHSSRFRNQAVKEEEMAQQMDNELSFSGRLEGLAQAPQVTISGSGTGLMPIQIEIPTGGQVYRFAKTIVKTEDPLTIKVFYVQNWVIQLIRYLIWIIVLIILVIKRKWVLRLLNWLKNILLIVWNTFKKYEKSIIKLIHSPIVPVIFFILLVLSLRRPSPAILIWFSLFLFSLVYQIVLFTRKMGQKKSKAQPRKKSEKK